MVSVQAFWLKALKYILVAYINMHNFDYTYQENHDNIFLADVTEFVRCLVNATHEVGGE